MKPFKAKKKPVDESDDEEIPIDKEFKGYIPSDSEEDYTESEKKLLAKARKNLQSDDDESDEEIYGLPSSDEMGSDLDKEDENLPNVRAWGKEKKRFYETDYVDQDYGGFTGKDAEEADFEEKEARDIQQRMAKSLDDTDFSFDLFVSADGTSGAPEEDSSHHVVKSDLSTLSKRQRQALFHKESPEFASLVEDLKAAMTELEEKVEPFLALVKSEFIPRCAATELVETKYRLTLNYVTNITFYLLLKARRCPVKEHPIIPRLVQYRKLLHQIAPLWSDIVEPQVDQALALHDQGKLKPPSQRNVRKRLGLLAHDADNNMSEQKSKKIDVKALTKGSRKASKKTDEGSDNFPRIGMSSKNAMNNRQPKQKGRAAMAHNKKRAVTETQETEGKRGITRQIQKNKGLTPRRKKEQRNPRVKNRNRYQKAVQKRKGQVRTVRTEVTRYGGERSGIKSAVKKGIKIKV